MRPGITDPATLRFDDEAALLADARSYEETYVNLILPEKLRLNLDYMDKSSFFSDLRLILSTLLLMVKRKSS